MFPFINDLFTDRLFVVSFLSRFSKLGPLNEGVLRLISRYFQWKKATGQLGGDRDPVYFDFTRVATLRRAESTFYKVGVSNVEAKAELDRQLANLDELARFIVVRIQSVVNRNPDLMSDRRHIGALDFEALEFSSSELAGLAGANDYQWDLDVDVFGEISTPQPTPSEA